MNWRRSAVVAAAFMALSACGGGGGGGGNGGLDNGACDTFALPSKIIDGTSCGDLGRSPIIRVLALDTLGRPLGTICTGTFISGDDVLTAAHCFPPGSAGAAVVTGDAGSTASVTANQVVIHPAFGISADGTKLFDDVAILKLPAQTGVAAVPILRSISPQEGEVVQVFGYGEDEEGNTFDEMKSGEMRIVQITENHLRADFDGKHGSNVCFGDSGGPMIFTVDTGSGSQPTVVGVVSFGNGTEDCGRGDMTSFTNLQKGSVIDFILEHVPDAALF